MSVEVHVDWQRETLLTGRIHAAKRNAAVSFEYDNAWLARSDRFALDPAALPLVRGMQHASSLFGVVPDCDRTAGPGAHRARRAQEAVSPEAVPRPRLRVGVGRRLTHRRTPLPGVHRQAAPLRRERRQTAALVRLNTLLRASEAVHQHTETAQDLRYLLGEGSPLEVHPLPARWQSLHGLHSNLPKPG